MHTAKPGQAHPRQRGLTLVMALLVMLITPLLLGGCATTNDTMDDLNKTLRGYEKAIRWAEYEAAYSFHKWEDDAEPSIPADIENIRVTHFETVGEKFNQKEMTMKRTVKLRYYNVNHQREKALKFPQEWKYFKESKRWYLISAPITFP